MRQLFFFLLVLAHGSCTLRYQYLTVKSDQFLATGEEGLIMENDSLRISYILNGKGGPLQVTIFNKIRKPLAVNWQKSAFVMNGKAVSFYEPSLYLSGSARLDTVYGLYPSARLQANLFKEEPVQYIPPDAAVSKTLIYLPLRFFENLPFEKKKQVYNEGNYYKVRYQKISYAREGSPVRFRSYLVFSTGPESQEEFSVDHHFYVSEILQTLVGPESLPPGWRSKRNVFYLTN